MLVFSVSAPRIGTLPRPRTRHDAEDIHRHGVLLVGYGLFLDRVLDLIGTLPYALRLLFCFALIFPPAFLMGFPMPTAMTSLARLGKDHMFLWAWGINGCFSVIGAAAVPIIATSFGLNAVLMIAGGAYLLAMPVFFACSCRCNHQRRRHRRLCPRPHDRAQPAPGPHRRHDDAPLAASLALVVPALLLQNATIAMSAPAPKRELAPLRRRRRRWFPSR